MKAFALLIPVMLVAWSGPVAAQEPAPAFNLPEAINHIQLQLNGGTVVATAANPADPMNILAIQSRLAQMAMIGVPELKVLGDTVKYSFEPTADGAQLLIRTDDRAVLNSIHYLLRREIRTLETGDSDRVDVPYGPTTR